MRVDVGIGARPQRAHPPGELRPGELHDVPLQRLRYSFFMALTPHPFLTLSAAAAVAAISLFRFSCCSVRSLTESAFHTTYA